MCPIFESSWFVDEEAKESIKSSIVSQRSSLELASWSQKAGSSPQNPWPIVYDIGASQVSTKLRQFKNV